MAIIYTDVVQYTPRWEELRCGVPTASQFSRIITPSGKPSKSAEMYRFELIAERLLGKPTEDAFKSHWMDRGSEMEADAVAFYELERDMDTIKVGFVTNDKGTIGASPDRLVGENGLLEIKIGKPATHIAYLLQDGSAYEEHRVQSLGQLWVAEREFNDLMAYNPGLPPVIHRANRDEAFIKLIAQEVEKFSEELERQYAICVERGWGVKPARPHRSEQDQLIDDLKASLRELNRA